MADISVAEAINVLQQGVNKYRAFEKLKETLALAGQAEAILLQAKTRLKEVETRLTEASQQLQETMQKLADGKTEVETISKNNSERLKVLHAEYAAQAKALTDEAKVTRDEITKHTEVLRAELAATKRELDIQKQSILKDRKEAIALKAAEIEKYNQQLAVATEAYREFTARLPKA